MGVLTVVAVTGRDGVFSHNLVVYDRDDMWSDVNVGPNTAPETFTFRGNWWYNIANPSNSEPNLLASETGGIYGDDPQLRDPRGGDYRRGADAPGHEAGADAEPRGHRPEQPRR